MMPDFLLVYNIAPSTYTFLLKVKSKEGLWAFIHGKSRFSGLKTLFHTYTHTLSCIPGEFQVFYRVLDPFGYQMDPNIDDIAL